MEVPDLHLDAMDFKETPTKTQLVNAIRDTQKFLTRLGGSIIADGSYTIGDPAIGALLNGTIQLRAAADQFEAGPNNSGLAVPQPAPVPMPRR